MRFFRPTNGIQYLTLALVAVMAAGFIYGFNTLIGLEHAIQAERRAAVLASCEDQNHRHDRTISQLNEAGRKANEKFDKQHPNDPAAQAANDKATAAGVATFRLIFNASTPHQNCPVLANKYAKKS